MKTIPEFPFKRMVWIPRLVIASSKLKFKVLFFLYHYIPAFFADIVLTLRGSKLSAIKIYSKIYYHFGLYEYFMSHNWKFSNKNMQEVYSMMSEKEAEEFPMQILNRDDAKKYSKEFVHGSRKYIMKETDKDLVEARRKYKIFKVLDFVFWMTVYVSVTYYIYSKMNININNVQQMLWE